MDNTLMTIIGLFLAATLIFVIPLMSITERNDDITQSVVQTAIAEFVDKVSISGVIKPSDYEELNGKIASTGNTFEITIEVQHLDENPGKKGTSTSGDLIGENLRYSTFTSEILDYMYPTEGDIENMTRNYPLKKGDNIIVTVRNTNKTLAQQLRTFAYKVTGKGTYQVVANSSSMVVNSGNEADNNIININNVNKLYLYNYGNECTDITGGWYPSIISDWKNSDRGEHYTGAIYEKKSTYLCIGDKSEDAYGDGSFSTSKKIEELINYDKLNIKFKVKSAYSYPDLQRSEAILDELFIIYLTEHPQFIEYKDYINNRDEYKKRIDENKYEDYPLANLKNDFGNSLKNEYGQVYQYRVWNSRTERNKIGQIIEVEIPLTYELKQEIKEKGFHITLRAFSHTYYYDQVEIEVYQVYLTK